MPSLSPEQLERLLLQLGDAMLGAAAVERLLIEKGILTGPEIVAKIDELKRGGEIRSLNRMLEIQDDPPRSEERDG